MTIKERKHPFLIMLLAQFKLLKGREAKVKQQIGELSRLVLSYVMVGVDTDDNESLPPSFDAQAINGFLEALSPANRRMAVNFFRDHTHFKIDKETKTFGEAYNKIKTAKVEKAAAFLHDKSNDVWTYEPPKKDEKVLPADESLVWIKSAVVRAIKKAAVRDHLLDTVGILKAVRDAVAEAQDSDEWREAVSDVNDAEPATDSDEGEAQAQA